MKKIVKWIMLALAVLTVTFTLVACDGCSTTPPPGGDGGDPGTQHVHEYSNDWSKDETGHWHVSTCEHTGLKTDVIAHDYAVETLSVRSCTTDGETKYECKDCHYIKTETEKAGHTVPTEYHMAAVPATCLSEGNIEYWECKDCHKLFDDSAFTHEITRANVKVEQLTHEWQTKSTVQPTCTTYGMTLQECKNCHEEQEINIVAAVDHTWNKTAVTCTEGRECTVCHTHEDALGHKYSAIRVTYADCVSDGFTTYKCDNCTDSYETVTSHATGHSVTTWELQTVASLSNENITVAYPACTYVRVGHCVSDGCSAQVVDAANPMVSHVYRTVLKEAATCTQGGVKTHKCTNCAYEYDENTPINPDAHTWDDGSKNGKIITYQCTSNHAHNKTAIDAKTEVSTEVTAEELHNEIELQNASIQLDPASVNGLSGSSFTIQASPADNVNTGEYNNDTVYNFTLSTGDSDEDLVTTFDGEVTVRIPYELQANDDPDNIAILYIDEHGEVTVIDAQYIDGYAVFKTNHFSYYTVTRLTNEQRCKKYGHSWNGPNGDGYAVPATCTTDGYTQKKCLRCGETETVPGLGKLGHDMHETVLAALTCTTSGRVEHNCSRCSYKYTVVTPAEGHEFETVKEVKATCTASGYVDVKCKNCDESHRNVLVQLRHNYERQVTAPTCLASGYTTFTCVNCAKSYTDEILPATGHDYTVTTLLAATCTTSGFDTHTCKYCANSFVAITPATGHTWDIDEPNCGKGQTCLTCSEKGKPAVGEHTMVGGVCSVCGTGCTHNFVETRVAPTCETEGSLTKACEHCGIVESASGIPALGHTDGIKCDTCGKELIGDDFFVNTLRSMASTSFTLRLTDFNVSLVSDSGTESQTVTVEELYLGLDEDGELCAYGKGAMSYTDAAMPVESKQAVIIVIEKGMFYASVDMVGMSNYSYDSQNYNAYRLSNENEKTYIKASLDSLDEGPSELFQMAVAAKVYTWYRTEFVTLLDNVLAMNKTEINAVIKTLVGKLFTVSPSGDGFTLTLNAGGVKAISDALAKGTVKQAADEIFGEGTFDKFLDTAQDLLGRNLGVLLQDMTMRGVEIDDLLDSADSLLDSIMGCTLTEMFENMLDIELDIRAIIADEDNMSKTVLQIVGEQMGDDSLTAEMILEQIESVGDMDFYELIGGDKNAATEVIDELVDMANKGLILRLQLDKNGYLTSGSIACDVADKMGVFMTDTYNPHYKGTLEILLGKVTKYDYKALAREIDSVFAGFEFTREKTEDYWASRNATVVYGDDGSVKSASYTVKKDSENGSFNDREFASEMSSFRYELYEKGYSSTDFAIVVRRQDIREVSVTFGDDPMLMARQDCGNWYIVGVMGRISHYERFNAVVLVAIDSTTGEIIEEKTLDYYGGGGSGDNDSFYEFFYNKYSHVIGTDEVESDSSRHKYVEDTSKAVEPVGCSTPGKHFYNCSACGKSYTVFYTNGHKSSKVVYNYTFDTEDENCESGVTIQAFCTDCNSTLWTRHEFYHCTVGRKIAFKDYGGNADCGGYLEIYYCPCGEYAGGHLYSGEHEFDRREVEYKDYRNFTFVNTCALTSPACGFRYAEKHYTVGCIEYATYILDCTENGGKKASSYEYTFVYDERHDWRELSRVSAGEPCLYTVTMKCETCGEIRTVTLYSHDPEKVSEHESYNGNCTYILTRECSDCGRVIEKWGTTRHNSETVLEPTCSQYGVKVCRECKQSEYIEPTRHRFMHNGDKNVYFCTVCGLESQIGATGMITLEDLTNAYGNDEFYVIGYYCEKYGFNEQRRALDEFSVIVSLVVSGSEQDTPIEVYVDKNYKDYERDGNALLVAVSKANVAGRAAEEAAKAGLSVNDYDVRIAFVPRWDTSNLDYAITLTAGL